MLYLWLKAIHVIAVIAWMAGMLYLPRLFVYHVAAPVGSEASETFKLMEKRLLRFIMNPAMIVTLAVGLWLATDADFWKAGWLHGKLALVVVMLGLHGFFAGTVRRLGNDERKYSAKFWRVMNEVPTLAMIVIVILVVVKPF